jgi:hypothetical protein
MLQKRNNQFIGARLVVKTYPDAIKRTSNITFSDLEDPQEETVEFHQQQQKQNLKGFNTKLNSCEFSVAMDAFLYE